MLVLVWLLMGWATGAHIAYNHYFIAAWPLPARLAVILFGPITALITTTYFVGQFLYMLVCACIEPALDFIKR